MDAVVPSRRPQTSKTGNKENAPPAHGSKNFTKRNKTPAAPFQPKGSRKEELLPANGALKTKEKPSDLKLAFSVTLKKVTATQRGGKGSSSAGIQRQTHSWAFVSEPAAKLKTKPAEAPKPPAAVAPARTAPGLYRGRIIQSKIGAIWKSSSNLSAPDPKASAAGTASGRVGDLAKSRSKSVSEIPARGTRHPAAARSKSALDKRAQLTATSGRPAPAPSSARPAKTLPAAAEPKVGRPAASSSLSQYRLTVESAEERRAKLAEWLAAKGRSLKRPAMAPSAAPAKSKTAAKPGGRPKPPSRSGVEAQGRRGAEPGRHAAALGAGAREAALPALPALPAPGGALLVMETSLQLLEDSELQPTGGVEDIVVNLCYALTAAETPSGCGDDRQPTMDEYDVKMEGIKVEDDDAMTEVTDSEAGTALDSELLLQPEDGSKVKFNIKSTPYKLGLRGSDEDEADAGPSGENVGEVKLVTPVRRSTRIEQNAARLPATLLDHDPSVSSLAELLVLHADPNALILRKNPALLDDLLEEEL